ncbi:MAG TPA: acyl carrier protein [Phenylobacterium sp.]|jgi:polyketide biosynthesis acyl carrier protein|uniref:acyl carrier protein n=1 Tax=Phenylobacterium sp. TaxID=1871053 RepID=UPI002D45FE63|nr:acyl carrier protein [Phenylobacterium sp.]HZZ67811.1 acyl carrier protein [Phenylobacterium sp.]
MGLEQVVQAINESVREVLPECVSRDFAPTETLADLGANSVDRAEIIVMALEKLGLRLPLVRLAQSRNLGELADAIHGQN